MIEQDILVSSHVSRDFLQNSVYFNTLQKVIWEYVSNSLDNAKEEVPVTVSVELLTTSPKKIMIADNGMGMSRDDLRRFFQMHGENQQRNRGKRVRGRFGTGKSAAFGIANVLEIDTIKDGVRNLVRLTRKSIEAAKDGNEFPIEQLVVNEVVGLDQSSDGTSVYISEFNDNKVNFDQTIQYIERHLGRYKSRANVIINGHTCRFNEPASIESYEFKPDSDELIDRLGEITLWVKVAPRPVDLEFNGIDILSYGIWHETTLAGAENKDLSNRLFGEVDVERLEDYQGPIPAFDNTRNNQLNRANPLVVMLLGWIGQKVEIVRKQLVQAEEERKRTEQFKKLQASSKEIEKILNDDFVSIIDQYELARKVNARQAVKLSTAEGAEGETLPGDGTLPSRWQNAGHEHGEGKSAGDSPAGEGDSPRPDGPSLIDGEQPGSPKETENKPPQRKQRRGVFSLQWVNGSPEEERSEYKKEERTIYINLNHPQVKAAQKASNYSLDSRQFKEITYEIAVVEYAIAVQYERSLNEELDAFDALFEVGSIIDRVTRKIALSLSD
jgi:hypothetical protein